VIVSFRDEEARRIWNGERSRRLPFDIQAAALRKLRLLSAAKRLDDLRVPPGNRLEALRGGRAGQYSVRIND
jgi:proteic killer suppression protein